jgi:hypothetical protein
MKAYRKIYVKGGRLYFTEGLKIGDAGQSPLSLVRQQAPVDNFSLF